MYPLLHSTLEEQLFPKLQLALEHQTPLQPTTHSLDFSDTAYTSLLYTRDSQGLILSSSSGLLGAFSLGLRVKYSPTSSLGVKKSSSKISNLQLMALVYP